MKPRRPLLQAARLEFQKAADAKRRTAQHALFGVGSA